MEYIKVTLKKRDGAYEVGRTIPVDLKTAARKINNEQASLTVVSELPRIKDLLESGYKSAYQRKLNELNDKQDD